MGRKSITATENLPEVPPVVAPEAAPEVPEVAPTEVTPVEAVPTEVAEAAPKKAPKLKAKKPFPKISKKKKTTAKAAMLSREMRKEKAQTLYTVAEVATLLNVHIMTARKLIRSGEIKAGNMGHEYRISKIELERYYRSIGGTGLFSE